MGIFAKIKAANKMIAKSGLPGAKLAAKIPAFLAGSTAAAGLLVGGSALAGTAGVAKVSGGGLFSKVKTLFKKKAPGAGTPLGNVSTDNIKAPKLFEGIKNDLVSSFKTTASGIVGNAMNTLGQNVGSTAHAIIDNISQAAGTGEPTPFGSGVKKGFLSEAWKEYKGFIIGGVIAFIIGLIIILKGSSKKR